MAAYGAPLSVQELTDQAEKYEYNAYIPLKNWLRTASNMQREVGFWPAAFLPSRVLITRPRPKCMQMKETIRNYTSCFTDMQASSSSICRTTPRRSSPRTAKRSMRQPLPLAPT